MDQAYAVDSGGVVSKPPPVIVKAVSVITDTGAHARCHVAILVTIGDESRTLAFDSRERGVGPVSGLCGAFRVLAQDFTWADFRVEALGPGENANAKATVTIKNDDGTFPGQGIHNNTLHAAALAIAEGLNKLRTHEWNKLRQREPAYAK